MDPLLQYLIRDIHICPDNGTALTEPEARLGLGPGLLAPLGGTYIRNSTPLVPIA
jgi:hypothetical protein